MQGILHVDATEIEATTGQMIVTFKSGGDSFRFHLPAHVALRFRESMMRDGWQILCAPNADVVAFKDKSAKVRKRKAMPNV